MRRLLLPLFALLLAAPAWVHAASTPVPGGTLKVALRGDPPTLDCHAISSSHVAFVLFPAYSTLLRFDPERYPEVAGDLAQSWSVSEDGLSYTFKLHPDVRFHDGTALTAEDVKASYDRLRQPPEGVISLRKNFFADIQDIVVESPDTVRFELSRPNTAMLSFFANPWNCIYSAAELARDPAFPSKKIMGSGPFRLVEQSPGSRIVYEKFPEYFKSGLPYLDRLELIVLSNAGVVPALSAGQVDADFFTFSAPLVEQIRKVRGDTMAFDTAEMTTGALVTFNSRNQPLEDVRVRRALNMAIDRKTADASLPKLVAVRGTSPFYRAGTQYALPPEELASYAGFTPDINEARKEARRLLEEAGVKNLKLVLLTPSTRDPYETYGVFLADSWRRIGVHTEIRALDAGAYQAAKSARDFDAVLEWNSSQGLNPIEVLDKFVPGTPGEFGGNADEVLVQLFRQIREEQDPQRLKALAQDFQRRMLDQAWTAPLLWATRTTALDHRLRGWKTPPTFTINLDQAGIWWDREGQAQ